MRGEIPEMMRAVEPTDRIGERTAAAEEHRSKLGILGLLLLEELDQSTGKLRPVEQAAADLDDRHGP